MLNLGNIKHKIYVEALLLLVLQFCFKSKFDFVSAHNRSTCSKNTPTEVNCCWNQLLLWNGLPGGRFLEMSLIRLNVTRDLFLTFFAEVQCH